MTLRQLSEDVKRMRQVETRAQRTIRRKRYAQPYQKPAITVSNSKSTVLSAPSHFFIISTVQLYSQRFNAGYGVKSNLLKHINFFESIGANQFVLDIIREGFAVSIESVPPSMYFKYIKSAKDNIE